MSNGEVLSCGRRLYASVLAFAIYLSLGSLPLNAGGASPFAGLAGRWVGEGKLGIKDSLPEIVKCRVTYLEGEDADRMKQNIRCATAGGAVEVLSAISHREGAISGTWQETTHNIAGNLEGQVTPRGFHVAVKAEEIAANMDITLRNGKQIVEIQFFNSVLFGLSMELVKG